MRNNVCHVLIARHDNRVSKAQWLREYADLDQEIHEESAKCGRCSQGQEYSLPCTLRFEEQAPQLGAPPHRAPGKTPRNGTPRIDTTSTPWRQAPLMNGYSLANRTRRTLPRVRFSEYARRILGASYELSVAIVGACRMRRINRTYRGIDATTDILAFPLSARSGEIILNLDAAYARSARFGLSQNDYTRYVFIHGLLHLKGYAHGRTMERLERVWTRTLGVPEPRR